MKSLLPTVALFAGISLLIVAAKRLLERNGAIPSSSNPDESKHAESLSPITVPAPANPGPDIAARAILVQVMPSIVGRTPSIAEYQVVQEIAKYETSYGKGWTTCHCKSTTCDMAGAQSSNNWGAVQARDGQPGFQWCDTNPDGSEYAQRFRSYPTPQNGAADMVSLLYKRMPAVRAALESENPTVWRVSLAMRRSNYYGSWCKKSIEAGTAVSSYGDPKGDPKKLACETEAAGLHVQRLTKDLGAIAAACGDPGVIPVGTIEDAREWYDARKKAMEANA